MKKLLIIMIIALIGLFIAGCVHDSVYYCPYCSSANIKDNGDGTYKCNNNSCGKEFGAKKIKEPRLD